MIQPHPDDRSSALEILERAFRSNPDFDKLGLLDRAAPQALRGACIVDPAEFLGRASGLIRAGVTAQISWARHSTRIGLGIETPVAHALVDRLLGDARTPAEGRLQVTPVEWGILPYLVVRMLHELEAEVSPELGPWDLSLDRLGADPFDARDLGPIITVRWGVRIGLASGAIRLWVPERLVSGPQVARPFVLSGPWLALAGSITLMRGIGTLRVGRVLPIDAATLSGSTDSPSGTIHLYHQESGPHLFHEAVPEPGSGGGRLRITSGRLEEAVSAASNVGGDRLDVVLGRSHRSGESLIVGELISLERESEAPIELYHGGKLVARGLLIAIESELGVRVTQLATD